MTFEGAFRLLAKALPLTLAYTRRRPVVDKLDFPRDQLIAFNGEQVAIRLPRVYACQLCRLSCLLRQHLWIFHLVWAFLTG